MRVRPTALFGHPAYRRRDASALHVTAPLVVENPSGLVGSLTDLRNQVP